MENLPTKNQVDFESNNQEHVINLQDDEDLEEKGYIMATLIFDDFDDEESDCNDNDYKSTNENKTPKNQIEKNTDKDLDSPYKYSQSLSQRNSLNYNFDNSKEKSQENFKEKLTNISNSQEIHFKKIYPLTINKKPQKSNKNLISTNNTNSNNLNNTNLLYRKSLTNSRSIDFLGINKNEFSFTSRNSEVKIISDFNNKINISLNSNITNFDKNITNILKNSLFDENEIDNLKEKINQKISNLGNLHIFSLNNIDLILKIFKEFSDILFKKILATLDQNKNFINYFKDILESYIKLGQDIEKAKVNIDEDSFSTFNNNKNVKEEVDDNLISNNIGNFIVESQSTIKKNFEKFSKKLNDSIISNGPFSKIETIINKFEGIKKIILFDFKFLETKKEKMIKKFNTRSIPIFTKFKKIENYKNKNSLKDLIKIFEENDFFLIEIEIYLRINKLYNKIYTSLKNLKKKIIELKECVIEYASLIKETVENFLNENKKIYGGNMSIDFKNMKTFYESITKGSLEKSFIVSRILGTEEVINKFEEYFNEYRSNILKYKIVDLKDKENMLKLDGDGEERSISNFESIEDLIDFFMSMIPLEKKLMSPLFIGKYNIKRDPGVFKDWKNCIILKTLQENLLIFDDVISKKPIAILNLKKVKLREKGNKKNPFKFELIEKKKGLLFDSTKIMNFDAVNQMTLNKIKGILYKEKEKD